MIGKPDPFNWPDIKCPPVNLLLMASLPGIPTAREVSMATVANTNSPRYLQLVELHERRKA